MLSDSEPPDWFWSMLDEARPSLSTLAASLEALPRERLVSFAQNYLNAAHAVCDTWDGPTLDGTDFSEDDTEDLNNWIVSAGREYWRAAVSMRGDLEQVIREYWANLAQGGTWSHDALRPEYRGFQSPASIFYVVFEFRFAADLRVVLEAGDSEG